MRKMLRFYNNDYNLNMKMTSLYNKLLNQQDELFFLIFIFA